MFYNFHFWASASSEFVYLYILRFFAFQFSDWLTFTNAEYVLNLAVQRWERMEGLNFFL